ncbi:hypothetical protein CR513_12130, partial [Mucuna pruriens]
MSPMEKLAVQGEIAQGRDRVKYVSPEIILDQSLPRATRHLAEKIGCDFDNANSDIADFDLGNSGSYFDFGVDISPFSLDNMANNDRTFKE